MCPLIKKDLAIIYYLLKNGEVSTKELSEIFKVTPSSCALWLNDYFKNKRKYSTLAKRYEGKGINRLLKNLERLEGLKSGKNGNGRFKGDN